MPRLTRAAGASRGGPPRAAGLGGGGGGGGAGGSSSRASPPRAACLGAWREVRPCLLTQYATVDGLRPTSRAIDSIERPCASWDASHCASTIRTLVRTADGTA